MTNFSKNIFGRSFAILAGGTLIAQVVQVASYPIIARLFTPEDFGIKAFFSMVLILCATVATGKYEEAVTIPKSDQEAVDVAALSIFISVLSAIFFSIFFFFFYEKIVRHQTEYNFLIYVILVPLGIIGISIVNTLIHWALRKGSFAIQSKVRVVQSSAKAIFELTGGFFKMGSIILVVGVVIGMAGGVVTFMSHFFSQIKKLGIEFRRSFSKEKLQKTFDRFINFPKYFILADLLNKVINHLPIFFLTAYSTIEIIGHYSIAVLAVAIPTSIFLDSILKVFYSKIALKLNENQSGVLDFFLKNVFISTMVSLVMAIGFFLLGKPFLLFAFGNQWEMAGDILKNYGWIILALTWFNMSWYLFKLLEKQKAFMVWNFAKLIVLSLGFLTAIQMKMEEKNVIWVYVLIMVFTSVLQLFAAYKLLKKRETI